MKPFIGRGDYWGPGCPRCEETLPGSSLPARGEHTCPGCQTPFQFARFEPPVMTSAAPRTLAATSGASCARHARNAAVATCEHCGAFMCSLCKIDADGKALCAACYDRLGKAGQLADARSSYRNFSRIALHLVIGSLIMWPLGPVLVPLAIILGVKGLRQSSRMGEKLGRGAAYAALVVAPFALLFSALILFSWFSVRTRR
jgi:hypothetical protein